MKRNTMLLAGFALGCAGVVSAEPVRGPEQDLETVLNEWTYPHMKEAEMASGMPASVSEVLTEGGDMYGFARVEAAHQAPHARLAGMLFYVSPDGARQHCSATVLDAPEGNLVLTAAHCAMEPDGKWKDKMMFVPAYAGAAPGPERAPYGFWPIHYKYIADERGPDSAEFDLAILSVFPRQGASLKVTVGGASRPCVTDDHAALPNSQMWGYPGANAYSGGDMQRCVSRMVHSSQQTSINTPNCATMSGTSGSGFRVVGNDSDHVFAVVHSEGHSARLRSSTFNELYKLASGVDPEVSVPDCAPPP